MVYLTEGANKALKRSKEIIEDQELETYINAQLEYRRKLGIAPINHEEHLCNRAVKARRKAQT